jgi:hypothetical protein
MQRNKECGCNRSNTNYESVKFEINESSLELKCIICDIDWLVGWANKKDNAIKNKPGLKKSLWLFAN